MNSNASSVPQASSPATTPQTRTPMTAEESRHELEIVIKSSNQVLAQVNTVLSFFPDTMTVDREKITVTKRWFFRMAEIQTFRIEDVLNVACSVGPILGTLSITTRVVNIDQTIVVGKFWRSDAKRLKRIAQGYVSALQRNIDCHALGTQELATLLEELGADNHQD
ncbi:MAG TPA: hypothetical protein VLF69_04245 [Candidatus Saccharimonadales bacterium]|nr:hypothetical protein [Candidatus Saccharimonadales bacterium]